MRKYKAGLVFGAVFSVMALAAVVAAPSARAQGAAMQMAPSKNIHKIRDAIQAANDRDKTGLEDAIVPYLADKVEAVHNPRFPNDGIVDGKKLGRSLPFEHKVHAAMLQGYRLDLTYTVKGDQILVKGKMTGKLPDGSFLVHPVNIAWTFDHGKIVKIWVDASTQAIKDGYRRQNEAMKDPSLKPLVDQWMAALKAP
jgi:hypothetical protein